MKLLRVLQEREFERVGDTQTVKVDVRVIAATNVDLQEEVAKSNFREDLFYRLERGERCYLPPLLQSAGEDIPRLIDHFLDKYNAVNDRRLRRISRDMLNVLLRYPWPGNVRELENAIERGVVLSNDEDFTEDLLPLSVRMFAAHARAADDKSSSNPSKSTLTLPSGRAGHAADYELREGEIYQLVIDQIEHALIERALSKCGGVKTKAADFLGINRNTLNKKVKELGIETVGEFELCIGDGLGPSGTSADCARYHLVELSPLRRAAYNLMLTNLLPWAAWYPRGPRRLFVALIADGSSPGACRGPFPFCGSHPACRSGCGLGRRLSPPSPGPL